MSSPPKIAVVTNAKKVPTDTIAAVGKALSDLGHGDCPWLEAPKGSKAGECARRAVEEGAELIVAVGGDGTVRSIAHELAGTKVRLGVVPTGTANLFATYLGLPKDPGEAVAVALGPTFVKLDVGRCNGDVFDVMAGVGFDAAMVEAPSNGVKKRLGMLAYVMSGAKEAWRRTPTRMQVRVDGTEWYSGPATGVLVANIGRLSGGVDVFPDASPFDGRLEVGVVTAEGAREWTTVMARMAAGAAQDSPHVRMTGGRKITVRLAGKEPYELDGGAIGTTRKLRFTCEPSALRVCVATPPEVAG